MESGASPPWRIDIGSEDSDGEARAKHEIRSGPRFSGDSLAGGRLDGNEVVELRNSDRGSNVEVDPRRQAKENASAGIRGEAGRGARHAVAREPLLESGCSQRRVRINVIVTLDLEGISRFDKRARKCRVAGRAGHAVDCSLIPN